MRTTVKNILKSCGIVAVVALLAFAFFKPMEGNLEARTVAKDGKMYDILPKLPKEKAEKEEENEILGIGGGGYYIADANYAAPPNSHSAETTEANDKAWEQAKKDDEAAEEAENAKQEVAEKPLEIVKTPELEKLEEEINKPVEIVVEEDGSTQVITPDENLDVPTQPVPPAEEEKDSIGVIVGDDGSMQEVSPDEIVPEDNGNAGQGTVEDNQEIIDMGEIPFEDVTTSEVNTSTNVEETVPQSEITQETAETTVQPEVLEEEVVEQPMEVVEVVVEW